MTFKQEIAYSYAYKKTIEFIKLNELDITDIEEIIDFFLEGYNQVLFKLNEKE